MSTTIALIRHGKPTITPQGWIGGCELPQVINRYQSARIASNSFPPEDVQALVQSAKLVFTSDLPRAMHSAQILEPTILPVSDPIFREVEFWLECPINIRLPFHMWLFLDRLLLSLGYSPHSQSQTYNKERVRKATELLEQKSYETGSVVLVGHGITNLFIARELKKRGWYGPWTPKMEHWGCTTYSL